MAKIYSNRCSTWLFLIDLSLGNDQFYAFYDGKSAG